MKEEFEFIRLVGNERRVCSTPQGISRHWQGERECFLFISDRDDDVAAGAGLLIRLAERENIPVDILIVTDRSMGYCSLDEKETVSKIRREEAFQCYQFPGVPKEKIIWLSRLPC
ncbi:MAG: PIG-L family deacetylase [Planctomycetota bacterium]|nr:MAG: PIG-L family deacetylase [Planctomycetota bacterium]